MAIPMSNGGGGALRMRGRPLGVGGPVPLRYLTTLSTYDKSCEPIIGALPAGPTILGRWAGAHRKAVNSLGTGWAAPTASNGKVGHLRPSETYPPDAERRFGCASASRGDLQVEGRPSDKPRRRWVSAAAKQDIEGQQTS